MNEIYLSKTFNTTPELYENYIFYIYQKGNKFVLFAGKVNPKTGEIKKLEHTAYSSEDKAKSVLAQYKFNFVKRQEEKQQAKQNKTDMVANAKAKIAKGELVKVGDIFSSSWGYDQTNVDFFKVLEVKGITIKVQQIQSSRIEEIAWEQYMTMPNSEPHPYYPEILTKRLSFWGGELQPSFSINSYSSAQLWNGKPQRISCYA